jgi:hypothetical protein
MRFCHAWDRLAERPIPHQKEAKTRGFALIRRSNAE